MNATETRLNEQLSSLRLLTVQEHYAALASEAAQKQWTHVDYLARLIDGEAQRRQELAIQRRIAAARFPCIKTLDQFDWNWPKKINRTQVQNLFRLAFLPEKANVVFMGGVGLGKSHLASALGYAACLAGHSVLFTTAVDIINTLTAAQAAYRLKAELKRLLAPRILCVDEVGYLPIDKTGADLLFQVISQRYERGSVVLTTNQPYKHWAKIFNNDSTLTSAVLDRLLHHADTVVIEGKSFRMKDQIEAPETWRSPALATGPNPVAILVPAKQHFQTGVAATCPRRRAQT
jgi:DNA replication protein DnaC